MAIKNADELPAVLIEFLNYLSVIKNNSQTTVNEYALDIKLFIKYQFKQKKPEFKNTPIDDIDIIDCTADFLGSLTLADAYKFFVYCKTERDNDTAARARKTTSIRVFYNYLYNNTHKISSNPMENLESPKQKKSLPKYLTLEQSKDLLSAVEGKNQARDYAILTLFLNCGMRLSELVSLNLTDIRSDNTIRVVGKGNKERTIYLNNACIAAINNYLNYRPVDNVIDKNALFLSNRLTRISPKTVQHIVKTSLEKAGLDGMGFSTHKLRHTAATLMYQYGDVDVLLLKEILGHESTSTTEIYTHIVSEQLKNAIDSNPLANINDDKGKKKSE